MTISVKKTRETSALRQDTLWREGSQEAEHWRSVEGATDGTVECTLSPKHCRIKPGKFGFCGVRGNVAGKLHTFNFGKSVSATQELIETEAVNHHSPNAKILSFGNVGCMMCCDFCQNWETSQVQHLSTKVVNHYTPQEIIDTCKRNDIGIISWTYNDPVVWHEFVKETSNLAHQNGIKTLYKSAFYIEHAPVEELLECIDIFSISLKSMDQEFYRKCGGGLQPVLERIKQVHASNKHLELSQLVITGRNDNEEEIQKTIDWVVGNLGTNVPLHFVAFHPAYKYMNASRTSVDILLKAREMALKSGINHSYIGNIYDSGVSDTVCSFCGENQIIRYGLSSEIVGLDADSNCSSCGSTSSVLLPYEEKLSKIDIKSIKMVNKKEFKWNEEAKALHVELSEAIKNPVNLVVQHSGSLEVSHHKLDNGLKRIILSKEGKSNTGVIVEWDQPVSLQFFPVLDRAHFPVLEDMKVNLMGLKERKEIL